MRVALDLGLAHRPGSDRGSGRYAKAIVTALGDSPEVSVEYLRNPRLMPDGRLYDWFAMTRRQITLIGKNADVYHALCPYAMVPWPRVPVVASVMDMIPIDMAAYRRTGIKARFFFSLLRTARAIVCLSRHTAMRLQEHFEIPGDRIVSAPLPVTCLPVLEDAPSWLTDELFVAALIDTRTPDPRKRLALTCHILTVLADAGVRCVIMGPGSETADVPRGVRRLGWVTDEVLGTVLREAAVFIYTSSYEGQGLPPQEALAFGTPVVAGRNTSLPEMLGPGALYVDEEDKGRHEDVLIGQFVDGARQLLADRELREAVGDAGRRHVAGFTTERFSTGILEAYYKAVCV